MDLFEVFPGDVRIYLGGGYIGMAQHGLDSPQIGTTFQKMCGKGMP